MKLIGSGNQVRQDDLYDASGSITTGGTAQLILPQSKARSYLYLQNNGPDDLWVEIGPPRATAVLTSGVVTSVTVNNAGMRFTYPPLILFEGGGPENGNGLDLGLGQPLGVSPNNVATAHAVMTGSAGARSISSIAIDNGGSGYAVAPYVQIINDPKDPYGAAVPSLGNAGAFFLSATMMPLVFNGTTCPTSAISVYGAVTGTKFTVKYLN